MNPILVKIYSGNGEGDELDLLSGKHLLLQEIAKKILQELGLSYYPTASAFSICSEGGVSLEMKRSDLSKLLYGAGLFDSDVDRAQFMNAVIESVLDKLRRPVSESKIGRDIRKIIASHERDIEVKAEFLGEPHVIHIPMISPVLESHARETGIYRVDSVSSTKSRCVLINCNGWGEISATFDPTGSLRKSLDRARSEFRYAELIGTSVYVGNKRKSSSFVVKEIVRSFDEKEFLELKSSGDFDEYFSVAELYNKSLPLRFK